MEQDTILRRQLQFRAWHRGTREADLLMGRFADAFLPDASADDVLAFAHLLTAEDPDLWDWVTGQKPVPADYDNTAFKALVKSVAERAL